MDIEEARKAVAAYFERNLELTEGISLLKDSKDGAYGDSGTAGLEGLLEGMKEDLARGDYRGIASTADAIIREAGLSVEKGSEDYRKVCREAMKAAVATAKAEIERMQGKYSDYDGIGRRSAKPEPKGAPTAAAALDGGRLLSELIREYLHECATGGRWRGRTKKEAEGCLSLFVRLVGDRGIRTLTRKDFIGFRDALLRYPASAMKKRELRGKTPKQIIEIASKRNLAPLSATSVNKYLVFVGALARWAVANGHASANYAERLAISKRNLKESDERSAYGTEDLKRLLASPLYQPATLPRSRPERYFIPLVALLSGMRLAEIAQLYLEDIKAVDGVPVFDVNREKDKALKNISSRRIVPIHSTLLRLGLLEYAEEVKKQGSARLWPNLKRTQTGYGQDFGRFYQRWNRVFVTREQAKSFHSFRHTFITALNRAHVPEAVVAELAGHSHGNIDRDRYGHGFDVKQLKEAVESARFGIEEELMELPKL